MEKKEIKISLGTFTIGIIAIVLLILVICMGVYILNSKEKSEVNIREGETGGNSNAKPSSVVINGKIDYYKSEGYGADIRITSEDGNDALLYQDINKYINKKYYVYIKDEYLGETTVKAEEGDYEGELFLNSGKEIVGDRYDEIMIDVKYNAIPRKSTRINITNDIKQNIPEINEYRRCDVEIVDLDGDNKFEYILSLRDSIDDNGKSKIIIANEKGEKIKDLVYVVNGYFPYATEAEFIDLSNVMYIDLDNDNKMEIVVHTPGWEGENYYWFKYSDNQVTGGTIVEDYSII